jgi:hypothetical protein
LDDRESGRGEHAGAGGAVTSTGAGGTDERKLRQYSYNFLAVLVVSLRFVLL